MNNLIILFLLLLLYISLVLNFFLLQKLRESLDLSKKAIDGWKEAIDIAKHLNKNK